MRIAITGAAGLFGHGLVKVFERRHTVYPLTRAEIDVTRGDQVATAFARIRPDVVIHSAAIPDLDLCEAEPARAYLVNVHGTRHVVEAAGVAGAAVAYISTDAVFDGQKRTPYVESDSTNPPTVYGRTKLRGEQITRTFATHWIFRVSLLFGPGKTNFIDKALGRIRADEDVVVASDQTSTATYTLDAAATIMQVIEARRYGLYHLSNSGACGRLELARRAAELAGLNPARVIGKPSAEMGRRAERLKYSVMEMEALRRAGFPLPRPWTEALAEYCCSAGVLTGVPR
ncbi:MAG TPA: NAD(P)-dependent oxidoreductase [Terriglobia bacterium]|nr:NAD(P)-dependent oxidoreductase [Terriglobia bacterium]